MRLGTSPRAWYGALSWHLRGLFASEGLRRIAFRARDLWQPAEVEARRGLARDISTELDRELALDGRDGYRMLPRALAVDEVCRIGLSIANEVTREAGQSSGNKIFSRFRIASDDERLALLRLALDRRLIAMVAAYFGVVPVITEADFYCSFPVEGPYTKSQLWHCDDDAGQVLKLFVYCDDVTDSDGPLQIVEPQTSRHVRGAIGYRYAGRRYRVADDVMDRFAAPQHIVSMIGPRGTTFVVDTVQCFHRGSRIRDTNHRRVAAIVCYAPPSAVTLPRRLRGTAPLSKFMTAFPNALEQAVLGKPLAVKWL